MGRISANLRDLELYAVDSENQLRCWKDDIDGLRQALGTLRDAMPSVHSDLQIWVPDHAGTLETLTARLEHLDSVFVRNVALGLAEADQIDFTTHWGYRDYPDVVVTADEAALDPGPANLYRHLFQSGQDDAEELLQTLDGLKDTEVFERLGHLHWDSLLEDDETRDAAVALLTTVASHMDEPVYVEAFYTTLGAEGSLGLASVLNDVALHYEMDDRAETARAIVGPVIDGFASFTHRADEAFIDRLFALDNSTANRDDQRLNLAILFSGDGRLYQSDHLATAGGTVVLSRNIGHNQADTADALVLGALAGNPEAASAFIDGLDGDGDWILTYAHRPYHEGATGVWLGTTDQDELLMLHNGLAAATWAHAQGLRLDELDPESWQPTPYGSLEEYTSTMIGFAPWLGEAQAADEALNGQDRLTGEELSTGDRVLAGSSVFFPFLPLRKIKHLLTRSDQGHPPGPPTGRPPGSTPTGPPDPERPIVWTDPLERLTATELKDFRYELGGQVANNWVHPARPASVADLPYGHPLRNLSEKEFLELGDHLNVALAESLFEPGRNTRSIDSRFTDGIPGGDVLQGKSDWEIYELIQPIVGGIHQMPSGVYLPSLELGEAPVRWDPYRDSAGGFDLDDALRPSDS